MEATRRQKTLRALALMVGGTTGAALLTLDPIGAFRTATFLVMLGAMATWTVVENAVLRQDEPKEYAAKRQTRLMQGAVMLAIFAGVVDAWHFRDAWPRGVALTGAGVLVLATGALFRIVAVTTLARHFSYELRIERGHELVQRGIYGVLRHPSYLGIILIAVGAPLIVQSVLGALVGLVVMTGLVVWRIRTEEAMLREAFGDDFDAYAERSWKLVPYVY